MAQSGAGWTTGGAPARLLEGAGTRRRGARPPGAPATLFHGATVGRAMPPTPAEALAEEMLHARARDDPAWATQVGLPGYDHLLGDPSPEAVHERFRELEALLARAEALPEGLERDVLLSVLLLERFEITDVRRHARNPDLAVELLDHVFALLVAAHLSDAEKLAAMASRLEGAPRFFEEGRRRFDPLDVPPLWVEGALESADAGPAFFDAVRAFAAGARVDPALARRVEAAVGGAEAALAGHRAWLQTLHGQAKGDYALGREAFAQLLHVRLIHDAPEDLMRMGRELTERFRREMHEAALTVLAEAGREPGDDPVAEALDVVKGQHPATFAEVLRAYESSIREAREFVRERGLATLDDVPLDVVETPPFLRHLVPFAAYLAPARFATPRRGTYLVTPKVDLRAFPLADVRNTTVHEAYPGHHLHLARSATEAPLTSFLANAPDASEGWALYCEHLMGEQGFTSTPAARFVRARDALWRAVRITLDVALHAGGLRHEEAAAMLSRETGMGPEEAAAEVLRYTQEPGYNLSYMWGRRRLEALRDEWRARGGDLRAFHDAVLAGGEAPVALVEARLLGGRAAH